MGRGYAGYGAMAPAYPGAASMVGTGYGYGKGSSVICQLWLINAL